MPNMPDESVLEQSVQNPPALTSEEGYTFSITIAPNGFTIDGEDVAGLTTLLKHVLAIVQEHENSGTALEQMSQGYQTGNAPIPSPAPR